LMGAKYNLGDAVLRGVRGIVRVHAEVVCLRYLISGVGFGFSGKSPENHSVVPAALVEFEGYAACVQRACASDT